MPLETTAPASIPIPANDQREIRNIYEKIRSHRAKLVGPDGEARGFTRIGVFIFPTSIGGLRRWQIGLYSSIKRGVYDGSGEPHAWGISPILGRSFEEG